MGVTTVERSHFGHIIFITGQAIQGTPIVHPSEPNTRTL
jgi:hypothetical protein